MHAADALKACATHQHPGPMGSKVSQLLTCALLCIGGVALLASGYVLGGITAIGVGAVLALLTVGRRNR